MILIIKHIDIEGPGTLGDFLKTKGEPFEIIELGKGDSLPHDPTAYKAVVVLGGPMNVDQEDQYPFLIEENIFIQQVLAKKIPYLGICLGSQLLAKAAGARVVKSPVKEIGWYYVRLTPAGRQDPFLKGFDENKVIYHWHEDMFEIPPQAELLATAEGCPHQVLKVGDNAYGIQFHVELTLASIKEWCEEYLTKDSIERREKVTQMLEGYVKYKKEYQAQANILYNNFLTIIDQG